MTNGAKKGVSQSHQQAATKGGGTSAPSAQSVQMPQPAVQPKANPSSVDLRFKPGFLESLYKKS